MLFTILIYCARSAHSNAFYHFLWTAFGANTFSDYSFHIYADYNYHITVSKS